MPKISAPGKGKLYHGVFPGGAIAKANECDLKEYLGKVRRGVAWVTMDHEWGEKLQSCEFPASEVAWIRANHAVPYIRLMLRTSDKQWVCEPHYTLEAIGRGDFDCQLEAWGRAAAKSGPLICEWGSEPNGAWFPWNGTHNGGDKGPPLFKAAFERIVKTIRAGGATDITWVFHVNHEDVPKQSWNEIKNYDPGPKLTDWIGVSLYGAQRPDESPPFDEFTPTMDALMDRLRGIACERPIVISEFGFTQNKSGGLDAVAWADDALRNLLAGKWAEIRGFSWWNESWTNGKCVGPTEMRVQCVPGLGELFRSRLEHSKAVVDRAILDG